MAPCGRCRQKHWRCIPGTPSSDAKCTNCTRDNFICKRFNSSHARRKVQSRAPEIPAPELAQLFHSRQPLNPYHSQESRGASSIVEDTMMVQPTPVLTKASIGIDLGSANSSVVYSIETTTSTRRVHVCKDSILPRLRVVRFANSDTQAPTLISYGKVSKDDATERFLFGGEVVDALNHETIMASQVIRWLKIALFDSSPNGLEIRYQIERQINHLPDEARFVVAADSTSREIDCHDLFSMYLGYLWRSTLRHMKKRETCLIPWQDMTNQDQYRGAEITDVEFEIAIAVPALATPQQCERVSEACKRTGLRPPSLFSEPSAAAYYLFQLDSEEGNPPSSQLALVVDIGAGTADLQIYDITAVDPLRMSDDIEGEGRFCGGHFVNQAMRALIARDKRPELASMLASGACQQKRMNEQHLLDIIETRFENEKRRFNPFDPSQPRSMPVHLGIDGIQVGRLVLDKFLIQESFDRPTNEVLAMARSQLTKFDAKYRGRKELNVIMLVGGGSDNGYVQHRFKDIFENGRHSPVTYPIRVLVPEIGAFTTIAKGTCLSLFDKDMMTHRVVRRSYGVCWNVRVFKLRNYRRSSVRVFHDDFENIKYAQDMSKFVIKKGDRVALKERKTFRHGWRGVFLDPDQDHDLEETIYYSDSTSKNNLDVTDAKNDIHELGKVAIRLTPERCQYFHDIRVGDKGEYYYLETAVAFVLDGLTMYYEFFLHKTGRWPKDFDFNVDLDKYGSEIIVDRGSFDANGAFQLHNCT